MPTFQVTYADTVLRQAVVKADTADEAETRVRAQIDDGEHHHAVDTWTDDWQAEPHTDQPGSNRRCFECDQPLQ